MSTQQQEGAVPDFLRVDSPGGAPVYQPTRQRTVVRLAQQGNESG